MLSSFEENTPPVVIFPENYYHHSDSNKSTQKSGMKKQVSFDDSITDSVEAKFSQRGLSYHSLLTGADCGSLTPTTNMSTISVGKQPSYRIIIFMWTYLVIFALFDT